MQVDAISAVLCGAAKAGPGRVVKGPICQAGDSVGGPWDAVAVALAPGQLLPTLSSSTRR